MAEAGREGEPYDPSWNDHTAADGQRCRTNQTGVGIMADKDLDKRVFEWLRKSGFPFELEVGRRFSKAGWSIAHGQPYEDPVEQKLREIDLYASRFCYPDEDGTQHSLSFVLAIECKSNPGSNPWVAFVDVKPRLPIPEITVPEGIGRALLLLCPKPDLLSRDIFSAGSSVAHNLVEVRFARGDKQDRPQQDPAYKAALACANAAVARANENESTLIERGAFRHVQIVIPVVVVKTPLYRYLLNEDGEEVLERQEWIKVALSHPTGGMLIVHVVTSGGLRAFASQVFVETGEVGTRLLREIPDVVEQHLKRHGAWRIVH